MNRSTPNLACFVKSLASRDLPYFMRMSDMVATTHAYDRGRRKVSINLDHALFNLDSFNLS